MSANETDSARLTGAGTGLLTALRRYALLVILCVVVAAGLGVLVTFVLPTHYSTDAQLVLGDQNNGSVFRTVPNLNATAKAQNATQVARSKAVHDRASQILNHRLSSDDVSNSVTASPGQEGNPLVTITAVEKSAKLARDAANAVGRAYLDVTRSQAISRAKRAEAALESPLAGLRADLKSVNAQSSARADTVQKQAAKISSPADRARYVQTALDADPEYQSLRNQAGDLTTNIATIDQKIQETKVDASLQASGVDTLYEASTPSNPRSSNLKRNAAIAGALGLLIGAAWAWRRLDRNRGVDHEQVAETLGAPLLAKLGRDRELRNPARVIDLSPGRPLADDLRGLASTLLLHAQRQQLSGFVVTSAEPGEGKTVLALNLAAAAHSAGHNVILVDGDARSATLTRTNNLDGAPGLSELLRGQGGDSVAQINYGGDRALPLIPIGNSSGASLSAVPTMRDSDGDNPQTIVDSPSLVADSAALLLASGGAGLVVVVSQATTLEDLRTIRSRADLVGAPIFGFVATEHRSGKAGGRADAARRHGRRDTEPAHVSGGAAAVAPGR